MDHNIVMKNGMIYIVNKDAGEPIELYNERLNFISSQQPENINDYNNAIIYSRIYINVNKYGCSYNSFIMNQLEEMIKKI